MWHVGVRTEVLPGIWLRKPEGKNPLVRTRHRWEDNIKMDKRNKMLGRGMDCSGLGCEVAGVCANRNKPSPSPYTGQDWQASRVPGRDTPSIRDIWHMDVVGVVSPTHQPPLPPTRRFLYSFLLQAVSTPMKNPNDSIGNRPRVLPACSAVPQSSAPQRTRVTNLRVP
jgi:hypothetical protein